MIVYKAPEDTSTSSGTRIFLAGSIELNTAELWQDEVTKSLTDLDVTILNPRRDDWDSSWKQEISDPQFNQQVTWELDSLDSADLIVLYLDPETKSPISLLELGLYAASKKLLVCCPEGFWRKGNVDIVCVRNKITQYKSLEELIKSLKSFIIFTQNKK